MTPVDPERGPSAFRRVRDHRRLSGKLPQVLLLCLFCCGVGSYQIAIRFLVHHVGIARFTGLAIGALGLVAVGMLGWRLAAGRLLEWWCARNGWSPAAERAAWPWTPQGTEPGAIAVRFAAVKTLQGLPITVGELSWTGDALGGSVEKSRETVSLPW